MGFSPDAHLVYGVLIPQEMDKETYETANYDLVEKLYECEISPPFNVRFGGSYDWPFSEVPCILEITEITWDYSGGTEVPDNWIIDQGKQTQIEAFCEEHGIPFDPKVWLIAGYG